MENVAESKFDESFWGDSPAFEDPLAGIPLPIPGVSPLTPTSEIIRQHQRVSDFLKQGQVGPAAMSSHGESQINNEPSSNLSPAAQFPDYEFDDPFWDRMQSPHSPEPEQSPQTPHNFSPAGSNPSPISEPQRVQVHPIQTGAGRMKKIEFHEGKIYKLFGETYIDKEIIPNEKTNNLEGVLSSLKELLLQEIQTQLKINHGLKGWIAVLLE